MSERDFAQYLIDLLSKDGVHAERFFDKGVLTLDEGIVAEFQGYRFNVTIQQSR